MRISALHSVALIASLVLCSCASMGSKATIYDQQALRNIRSVCLSPVSASFKGSQMNNQVRASIYDLLKKELDSQNLFSIVAADELRNSYPPELPEQARISCLSYSADAALYATVNYFVKFLDPVVNAEMTLIIMETKTGKSIATSSHNTLLGNSYFAYPSHDVITSDAVKGAVAALIKSLKGTINTKKE